MKRILQYLPLITLVSCIDGLVVQNNEKNNIIKTIQAVKNVEPSGDCYPHTSIFKKTKLHGRKCFIQNREDCKKCHGKDLKGGTSKVSCNSCHEFYPHKPNFAAGKEHGTTYTSNSQKCTGCHNLDSSQNTVLTSCQKCHNYPHTSQWALPANHGGEYIKEKNTNKLVSCLDCHDRGNNTSRNTEVYTDVTCDSCHVNIPHSTKFKLGWHNKVARTYKGKCTNCHKEGKRFMRKKWWCVDCHGKKRKLDILWLNKDHSHDKKRILK